MKRKGTGVIHGNKKHVKTQSEWEAEKAGDIINFIKSEIYLDLPFMGVALGALEPLAKTELLTLATDGEGIYYAPERVIEVFKSNTLFLDRAYLHSVLHCIFSHLWMRRKRDAALWSIACDIAVEYTIDHMQKPCTKRALSWIRQKTYQSIEKELSGISAATVYVWLEQLKEDGAAVNSEGAWDIESLMREFYTDDHRFWPTEEDDEAKTESQTQSKWNKIARQSAMDEKRRGDDRSNGQEVFAAQVEAGKNQRNYQDFLKKFSVLQEELHVDEDSFDVNYYTYGLRLYKNMPLLEPCETREVRKISEFVIVVDTSYSTSGELIKNFLKETFSILTETDSFFKKSRVRIIQCDDQVQMDEKICSEAEIEALMNRFTIVGGGGTDFRPAFSYVNELIENGELKNLSGLLYFTDGKGIYPRKRPDYKTAFLFLEDYEEEKVPAWAIRLRLLPEEFGGKK